jgi:hypothetical protein
VIFGESVLLPQGVVKDATIRVPNKVPVAIEDTTNQPALVAGTTVTINIVYDDGGGELNLANPLFVKDKTGSIVFTKTKIGTIQ